MEDIAILLTCHNRKEKTINALVALQKAEESFSKPIRLSIYLTDDGSTDGTAKAIQQHFPKVIILQGDGNLFWAGGMINSWREALKNVHHGYLLLNDDTDLLANVFNELYDAHQYSIDNFKKGGVYIGSTKDPNTQKLSYGGAVLTNKFLYKFTILEPNGNFQECDLGNANIMYVDATVVDQVGILSKGYVHGIADYDYTLKCKKNKIPVLVTKNYCGICERDNKGLYHDFHLKTFKERLSHLYSPTGIAFKSRLLFMRKFFPYRLPIFYLVGWFKVLFPKFYLITRNKI